MREYFFCTHDIKLCTLHTQIMKDDEKKKEAKAEITMSGLVIRQKIENRPGVIYDTKERTLSFTTGSLFSFPLHSTAYESDAASVRIPSGLRLKIHSASVGCKEMSDYVKISGGQGVSLKFSSEENGEMLPVWTFNWERSGEFWANGLGIEGKASSVYL